MDKTTLYRIWAPPAADWAPWVKPVLFAYASTESPSGIVDDGLPDVSGLTDAREHTALVIDLPGRDAIDYGLGVACQLGLRPIPLFSSVPPTGSWMPAIVPTVSLLTGIREGAAVLDRLNLPASAPPAFLVDAHRRAPGTYEVPVNTFDNRSALFASDFPSAELLGARGITRCVIVRNPLIPISPDLGYALLPWKKAGLRIECRSTDGRALDFVWPPMGFWSQLAHRLGLWLSLRPNIYGGYGRFVPESSGG